MPIMNAVSFPANRVYESRVIALHSTPTGCVSMKLLIGAHYHPSRLATCLAKCLNVKEPEELTFETPFEYVVSHTKPASNLGHIGELANVSPTGRLTMPSPELQNLPPDWNNLEASEIIKRMKEAIAVYENQFGVINIATDMTPLEVLWK